MKNKPVSETVIPWLKDNLGAHCLGVLTGTDAKALAAAVQIIELYAYDQSDDAVQAFALVVGRMQSTSQPLAYHAIAHVLDWPDRPRLWREAGLPVFSPSRCKHE